MSQQAVQATNLLVAAFDYGTRRVERIHGVIADYVKQRSEQGPDAHRAYELARTLGREVGETATGALRMAEMAQLGMKQRA